MFEDFDGCGEVVAVTDRIAIAVSAELWLYRFRGQKRGCAELLRILEKMTPTVVA